MRVVVAKYLSASGLDHPETNFCETTAENQRARSADGIAPYRGLAEEGCPALRLDCLYKSYVYALGESCLPV